VDLVITGGWSGGTVVLVKLTCDLNRYNGCVRTTNASGYRAFTFFCRTVVVVVFNQQLVVVVVLLACCQTTSQKEKKSFRNALRLRPVSLVSLFADAIVYRGMSAA
jgi:hypothetical protein